MDVWSIQKWSLDPPITSLAYNAYKGGWEIKKKSVDHKSNTHGWKDNNFDILGQTQMVGKYKKNLKWPMASLV